MLDLTPLVRCIYILLIIIVFIAYIGVFDDQSIDFETVLQLLQIIHQSTGFSKLSYNEDFNKYKSYIYIYKYNIVHLLILSL